MWCFRRGNIWPALVFFLFCGRCNSYFQEAHHCHSSTGRGGVEAEGLEVQDQPQLHNEFKVSLSYHNNWSITVTNADLDSCRKWVAYCLCTAWWLYFEVCWAPTKGVKACVLQMHTGEAELLLCEIRGLQGESWVGGLTVEIIYSKWVTWSVTLVEQARWLLCLTAHPNHLVSD